MTEQVTPALALSGVFKSYETGTNVLSNFNLAIQPGSFCVLLGVLSDKLEPVSVYRRRAGLRQR